MDPKAAAHDLALIKDVVQRSHTRIDPHAFHFIAWGAVVLIAYPVLNWLALDERHSAQALVGGVALGLGTLASILFEVRLARRPRLPGENTFVAAQVCWIVYPSVAAGILLSIIGPATVIPGPSIPLVWGFVYANMAFMIGVVYTREFKIAGLGILAATVAAMFVPAFAGFIVGPAMGLGMIIPGVMAERRVARARDGL